QRWQGLHDRARPRHALQPARLAGLDLLRGQARRGRGREGALAALVAVLDAGSVADGPDSLLETVAALKHDLGKYVAWTSANLADEAWSAPVGDELVGALRADILETRKAKDGSHEAACEVWSRFGDRL